MNELSNTLIKLQTLLEQLKTMLSEELRQLNRLHLNPVTLQMLSDNKSRLLSTINYYEDQRKIQEEALGIAAPYDNDQILKPLWQNVIDNARITRDLNSEIYPILELKMQKAVTLKSIVSQVSNSAALYNADGRTQQSITGKACNINI